MTDQRSFQIFKNISKSTFINSSLLETYFARKQSSHKYGKKTHLFPPEDEPLCRLSLKYLKDMSDRQRRDLGNVPVAGISARPSLVLIFTVSMKFLSLFDTRILHPLLGSVWASIFNRASLYTGALQLYVPRCVTAYCRHSTPCKIYELPFWIVKWKDANFFAVTKVSTRSNQVSFVTPLTLLSVILEHFSNWAIPLTPANSCAFYP